jgi:integrase
MQIKPLKINNWLRIRQQFIQTLRLLVHFSGGAPVRGSEILTVTFKNASTMQRGVFIKQGEKVMLLKTRYSKPSSMTGQDNPTIRVLSKRISQILVHYLVIALPLYQYLMQKQHEANNEIYYISNMLFEINGKPMTNDALRRRLALHCKIHLHNSLGLLGWRHSAKYIIKTRVIRNTGIVLLSDNSSSNKDNGAKLQWIEDRQSNHTS